MHIHLIGARPSDWSRKLSWRVMPVRQLPREPGENPPTTARESRSSLSGTSAHRARRSHGNCPSEEGSTNYLCQTLIRTFAIFLIVRSGRSGSNPQPTAWEAATLPLSYSRSRNSGLIQRGNAAPCPQCWRSALSCKTIFTSTSHTRRGTVHSRRVPAARREAGLPVNGPVACSNSTHSCLE